MTAKEAISQLQERIDLINKDYFDLQFDKYAEALQMAIEALNQFAEDSKKVSAEGRHKKDLISKADVCEILADVFPTDGEKVVYVEEIENAYQEIIALPYVQPKRTEKRTETHACDLISRAMLLEYIHNEPVGKMLCDKYNLDGVIKQLPFAQPERDIPIKPTETTDKAWGIPHRQAVCPRCDYYLGHVAFLGDYKGKRITYCETCGQAIDWEGWNFDE